jgi:hypothetical protein
MENNKDLRRIIYGPAVIMLGFALIVSPWLRAYSHDHTAVASAILSGTFLIRLGLGASRSLRPWVARVSIVAGLWTAIAPGILGFVSRSPATLVHLVTGAAVILLAISLPEFPRRPHERRGRGASAYSWRLVRAED